MKDTILGELNRRYKSSVAPNETVTSYIANPHGLSQEDTSAFSEAVRTLDTVRADKVVDYLNHLSTMCLYDVDTDPEWEAKNDAWNARLGALGRELTKKETDMLMNLVRMTSTAEAAQCAGRERRSR